LPLRLPMLVSQSFPAGAFKSAAVYAGDGVMAKLFAAADRLAGDAPTPRTSKTAGTSTNNKTTRRI
jgi:hypothetical protein